MTCSRACACALDERPVHPERLRVEARDRRIQSATNEKRGVRTRAQARGMAPRAARGSGPRGEAPWRQETALALGRVRADFFRP